MLIFQLNNSSAGIDLCAVLDGDDKECGVFLNPGAGRLIDSNQSSVNSDLKRE